MYKFHQRNNRLCSVIFNLRVNISHTINVVLFWTGNPSLVLLNPLNPAVTNPVYFIKAVVQEKPSVFPAPYRCRGLAEICRVCGVWNNSVIADIQLLPLKFN